MEFLPLEIVENDRDFLCVSDGYIPQVSFQPQERIIRIKVIVKQLLTCNLVLNISHICYIMLILTLRPMWHYICFIGEESEVQQN